MQIVAASETANDLQFPAANSTPAPPDLHEVLGQLIALRHEVNLQTRASRAQQEQNTQTLGRLGEALELLQNNEELAPATDSEAKAEAVRPMLKALVDAHDALSLARREVQRVQANLKSLLDEGNCLPLQRSSIPVPAWSRWLGLDRALNQALEQYRLADEEQSRRQAASLESVRQLLDSIVSGYTMSLQRLDRTLEQQGLEAIPCLGEVFNPEVMEVVEVLPAPGNCASEVIEEVRRGYFWQGRVFRFAQVKVSKPSP